MNVRDAMPNPYQQIKTMQNQTPRVQASSAQNDDDEDEDFEMLKIEGQSKVAPSDYAQLKDVMGGGGLKSR